MAMTPGDIPPDSANPNPTDDAKPQTRNWLTRFVQRFQGQRQGDTIAAEVGADAQNVAVGKNIIQIGALKIPRIVALILVIGIIGGLTAVGFIAFNTFTISGAVTAPTPTPTLTVPTATPTVTPLPTATSLAFATEAPSETLILVATFFVSAGNHDTLAHREIRDRIQEEAKNIEETKLRAEIEPAALASDQRTEAEALGTRYHASMVIWGDDTGARMTVNFLNLRQPDFKAATVTISETARTQIADPSAYHQFIVDDLPRQLTFLALFAVGQSYYSHQDYPHALADIEAAITSLGEKAEPVGLADAYFRLGWLYQVPMPNDLSQAIANYTKAIAFNPD